MELALLLPHPANPCRTPCPAWTALQPPMAIYTKPNKTRERKTMQEDICQQISALSSQAFLTLIHRIISANRTKTHWRKATFLLMHSPVLHPPRLSNLVPSIPGEVSFLHTSISYLLLIFKLCHLFPHI